MGRVDQAKAVRAVGVVCGHFAAFDNQTGRHAAGIFAVDEDVGRHLAENGVPQTAALYAFQVKRVGQVLLDEGQNAVVTIQQVGADQVPVIIPIHIHLAQQTIRAVRRANIQNEAVCAEKHHPGKRNAAFSSFRVNADQLCAFEQGHIIHINPGMRFAIDTDMTAAAFNEVGPQIFRLYPRINAILTEVVVLTQIELRHQSGAVSNVKVAIFITVINTTVTTVYLGAFRNMDKQDNLVMYRYSFNGQIGGGRQLLRVVDGSHEILADLFHRLRGNAADIAVILDAQKQEATVAVEKCADALVHITVQLLGAGLELQGDSFTLSNEIVYLLFAQHHGASPCCAGYCMPVRCCFTRKNS